MPKLKFDRFFPPSPPLTNVIMTRLRSKRADFLRDSTAEQAKGQRDELLEAVLEDLEEVRQRPPQEIQDDQRWLREIIYQYLGGLARRGRRQGIREFSIEECMQRGVSSVLGLSSESDAALLNSLAQEFRKWLRVEKTFVAGWGIIAGDPYDSDKVSLVKGSWSIRATVAPERRLPALEEIAVGMPAAGAATSGVKAKEETGEAFAAAMVREKELVR